MRKVVKQQFPGKNGNNLYTGCNQNGKDAAFDKFSRNCNLPEKGLNDVAGEQHIDEEARYRFLGFAIENSEFLYNKPNENQQEQHKLLIQNLSEKSHSD